MTLSSIRTKHWTRAEYERLVDLGAFRPGERLELVGGALVVREPQGGPHATAVGLVEDALRQVFVAGWTVRAQSPIALDEESTTSSRCIGSRSRIPIRHMAGAIARPRSCMPATL